MFFLVIDPTAVMMHPQEYVNDLTSMDELRALGKKVRVQYLQQAPACGGAISMTELIGIVPRWHMPRHHVQPRHRPPSKKSRTFVDIPSGTNDDFVIKMLQDRLIPGQWYQDDGSDGLPGWVWPMVKAKLPWRGFLPFLEKHSAIFEVNVTDTNRRNHPRFRFRLVSPEAASGATQ